MKKVYGQKAIYEEFYQRAKDGQLPHALLILGDKGGGKKTLAKNLAYLYLGAEKGQGKDLMDGGNHPDFHLVEKPEGALKKEDIVNLIEDSQKTAYLGHSQVFVVAQVDQVTPQGQNALLKTLEEPKEGVAIFLTGTNKEKILPTILSRCRVLHLPPLAREEVKMALEDLGYGRDPSLDEALALSRGSLGRALSFLENPEKTKVYQDLFKGLMGFTRKSMDYPFVFADFFLDHGDLFDDLIFLVLVYYRDLLVLKDKKASCLAYLPQRFQPQSRESLDMASIYKILKAIEESIEFFAHNGNKRLGIENLLMKIQGEYL